jgi:hypothetical protein
MTTRLSSLQTFPIKFIFPPLWIGLFGFGALGSLFAQRADQGASLALFLVWIAGSAFIYWSCIRLKRVSVDDHFLYVSNYLKEISIPLSDISGVTEFAWINSHPVTIHLKFATEFGDKIVFMPKTRWLAFFSSHPVVGELKELARLNGADTTFLP